MGTAWSGGVNEFPTSSNKLPQLGGLTQMHDLTVLGVRVPLAGTNQDVGEGQNPFPASLGLFSTFPGAWLLLRLQR